MRRNIRVCYYARRWEIYFDAVIGAAEKGIELDKDELKSRLATFEQEWVDSTTPIQIHREGSLLDTARHFSLSRFSCNAILQGDTTMQSLSSCRLFC